MKSKMYLLFQFLIAFNLIACSQNHMKDSKDNFSKTDSSKFNKLSPEEEYVIINKGTERPYTGKFYKHNETGVYVCRRCNAPLYRSNDKFDSHCGWPSFDDEIKGAVKRVPDADAMRTEIICNNCGAHLGHVFEGEGLTDKDTRHCVNSVSLDFIPAAQTDTALFASGCFWGTEYYLQQVKGVISTEVGYCGGTKDHPTYKEVSKGNTGYAETVQVVFDPRQVSYEELTKIFFETHDPTQKDGQGPDIGNQYRSAIFYRNEQQKEVAEKLIKTLKEKGLNVVTELTPAGKFWTGEDYHQDYYKNSGGTPYCHKYTKRF